MKTQGEQKDELIKRHTGGLPLCLSICTPQNINHTLELFQLHDKKSEQHISKIV